MARDPGSIWKPLPEAGAPDGLKKTQFIVHSTGTMASAAANWSYFSGAAVAVESTFIIGLTPADPTLQIMDSTDRADANGSANSRAISVEVVGNGIGPFTPWQVSEIIRIGRWARRTHGILPRIIPSEAAGGFGWHVMFGAPGPWTSVNGKICPGGARITQLKNDIFPAIFAADAAPDSKDWFDMATREDLLDLLRTEGISGSGDVARLAKGLEPVMRKAVSEEVAKVLRTEGISGAGDHGRLAEALEPVVDKLVDEKLGGALPDPR